MFGLKAVLFILAFVFVASALEAVNLFPKVCKGLLKGGTWRDALVISLSCLSLAGGIAWCLMDAPFESHLMMSLTMALVFCVIACDTGAYVFGCLLGKRLGFKIFGEHYLLAPNVSSKKTKVGALAGMIIGGLAFSLLMLYFGYSAFWELFSAGMIISLFSIAGDLSQSFYKRKADVKDSGSWLCAHGGVWDRTDALSFVFGGAFLVGTCYAYFTG
jgi:CDP-diglyceride synthetase